MIESSQSEFRSLSVEDYAERRRQRARQRTGNARRRLVLVGGASLAALLVVAAIAEAAVTSGRIHPGVTVAGIAVGGMTADNAVAALGTNLPSRVNKPVVVTYEDEEWAVTSEDIGLTFDHRAQVDRAMRVGRDGNAMKSLGSRLQAWTGGVEVGASPIADDEKLDAALDRIAKGTDVEPVDATVKIKAGKARIVPGSDGKGLHRPDTAGRLLEAFTSEGDRKVEARVVVVPMRVDERAASEAAAVAQQMMAKPVTITFEDESWEFDGEDIAKWIAFKPAKEAPSPAADPSRVETSALVAHVSEKRAAKPITSALGTEVGKPAKDARFTTSDGRVTIIPSEDGVGPDVEALALALTQELTDPEADRKVELRTTRAEPEITTEKARKMGIKERISTYTTTFESGNRPRVNNIHTLGKALDGALIPPGGVFSFNGTAGERTAEKGYQEAAAIVNGRLVPQLGGGVCQVGTTVFNAAFESGLPIVERRNHSFYISHYPKGRDATVSWGGPDLKFKNDTETWVLVSVSYSNTSITVSLYGTDPGYEVTAEAGKWTNMKPYSTQKVKDDTLAEGTKVVRESGVQGRSMTVKRIVSKDGKVVRTDSFVSNYKPKVQVVAVGTKRSASKTTTRTP